MSPARCQKHQRHLPLFWRGTPLKTYQNWSLHHSLWAPPRNYHDSYRNYFGGGFRTMYIITNNDLYVSTLLWFLFASLHPRSSTGSHKNYLGWAASFFWNSCAALEIYSCTSWCRTFHLHLDMIYWSELESTTPLFRHEEIRLCMRNRSPTFPSSLCLYLSQGSLSAGLRGPQLFLG